MGILKNIFSTAQSTAKHSEKTISVAINADHLRAIINKLGTDEKPAALLVLAMIDGEVEFDKNNEDHKYALKVTSHAMKFRGLSATYRKS